MMRFRVKLGYMDSLYSEKLLPTKNREMLEYSVSMYPDLPLNLILK